MMNWLISKITQITLLLLLLSCTLHIFFLLHTVNVCTFPAQQSCCTYILEYFYIFIVNFFFIIYSPWLAVFAFYLSLYFLLTMVIIMHQGSKANSLHVKTYLAINPLILRLIDNDRLWRVLYSSTSWVRANNGLQISDSPWRQQLQWEEEVRFIVASRGRIEPTAIKRAWFQSYYTARVSVLCVYVALNIGTKTSGMSRLIWSAGSEEELSSRRCWHQTDCPRAPLPLWTDRKLKHHRRYSPFPVTSSASSSCTASPGDQVSLGYQKLAARAQVVRTDTGCVRMWVSRSGCCSVCLFDCRLAQRLQWIIDDEYLWALQSLRSMWGELCCTGPTWTNRGLF